MMLEDSLERLDSSKDKLKEAGLEMMKAAAGLSYPLDLLALAAISRTLHLIPAFRNAVETENFFVAAPIVRLHLDSCLRFSAAWIVDKPHDYATAILDGTPTYKLKDSAKQKMTDTYLVAQMAAKYPWMPAVYEKCSGFVHLSRLHILPMFTPKDKPDDDTEEGRLFEIAVGFGTVKLDQMRYIEAVEGFNAITKALLDLLIGWTYTKDNPEAVAKAKAERQAHKTA